MDVAAPYYLNLAPNYDATLTPRYMADRGVGLETEFRHLGRRSRSAFGGAFLQEDDNYDGALSREDFLAGGGANAEFSPADRWLLDVSHQGRFGPFATLLNYAAVSDPDYFVDLGSDLGASSRVALRRRGEIRYAKGGLAARLWAEGYQRLEPGLAPYRRLPEADVRYAGAIAGPLAWSLRSSWSSFRRSASTEARGIAAVEGERLHLEPRLRLLLRRPWGHLSLTAGARHTAYDLRGAAAASTTRRNVRLASADGGLVLERALGGGARRQTLEPRLFYLRQTYAAQDHLPRFDAAPLAFAYRQLFRDNRFAGLDRIGDANQFSLGVTSRLLDAASGRELVSVSMGGIRYLQDRRVTLGAAPQERSVSALAGELRAPLGAARLAATLVWDGRAGAADEAGLAVGYRPDRRRILNFGYRRRRADAIDQTDVSFHWPLAARWTAFGRWNHDWRFGQTIEALAGVGYADCCLQVKALWHRTVDAPRNHAPAGPARDSGIALQLAFRGLAGVGTKVDSRLAHGIKGYRGSLDR